MIMILHSKIRCDAQTVYETLNERQFSWLCFRADVMTGLSLEVMRFSSKDNSDDEVH